MEISIGEIILDEEIKLGNIELDVVKEYPYLENLEITPTAGQQIFTHPDSYGYDEVKVDAINLQDKSVTPTQAQQIIFADIGYSGLNNVKIEAVTSDIDSNIQSYNIKKDVSILGVTGNVIELNGEERAITPTKDTQIITPSADKNAITKMTVNPIPDEYIIPSGEIEITENGNYNVTDKASAKVNVPEKQLGTKTITKNGVYNASDDNLDGYSQVEVETSGVDLDEYFKPTITSQGTYKSAWDDTLIKFRSPLTVVGTDGSYLFYNYPLAVLPEIDTSNVTIFTSMFENCKNMVNPPTLNTSKAQLMYGMFRYSGIVNAPELDTSNVIRPSNMSFGGTTEMFYSCQSLVSVPEYDFGKNSQTYDMFKYCTKLTTLGGFLNYGKALSANSALDKYVALDLSTCTQLTHDSLMNVINKLYDIASAGYNTQKLVLGSTNLAKLTAEEVAIGTSKGWSIS